MQLVMQIAGAMNQPCTQPHNLQGLVGSNHGEEFQGLVATQFLYLIKT